LYWSSADRGAVSLNLQERPTDYKSDIYVLALFKHQDHATLDILNMEQWCFWVLTKDRIKEITKNGNSVSLLKLQKFDIAPVGFTEISRAIADTQAPN